MEPDRIVESFPAPSFRGNQRAALERIRDAFAAGNEVVLVRAPTGSGKSLLARAIAGSARTAAEADPAQPTGAYYTTPQVSQLEDVAADPLLEDVPVVRGKSNYTCILPGEETTPVDRAPCARERGYDCSVKHRCPYFSDRSIAANRSVAAMTLAYFMRTAGSDVFRPRDVVVIDEAHGLGEWAETYATIELGPRTVPVWDDVGVPDVAGADDARRRTVRFAETLADVCEDAKDDLLARSELAPAEAARRDRLQELISELRYFARDARDLDSPTTWVIDQPDGEGGPVTIKPLNPERHLSHTVWDRGERFALLSATILDREAFCRGVGLDPDRVALVDVDHTFPVENRPLYDVTRGPMTYEHRDETLPDVARLLVRLMARHPEEKGIVHAHSYGIQSRLAERLDDFGVGPRVRSHDREDRDAALAEWKASDDPDLFLSVKMEEALDLEGDLARWQVVCKAPYRNTSDSRVERRLADGQWAWYHRDALRTVIQACGRVVRAPDDFGATYLADSSLLDLFDRASADVPGWFREQVDRMTAPDLPAFDPAAALAGVDAAPTSGAGAASRPDRSRRDRDDGGTGASRSSADRSTAADGRRTDDGRGTSTDPDARRDDGDDHPLSDVWGDG
ncbi:MAG: helicase C-terminal domain-containing protein [Haloferacaceae archaeon]